MPAMLMAIAYLNPARTVSWPGTTGQRMDFRAGRMEIRDPAMLTLALRREDVTLVPDGRYAGHVDDWLAACGENQPAKATVALPDGSLRYPPGY